MTEYEDKYGNTYYVHIHEGGGWGVRVEDKLRKRIRWSRGDRVNKILRVFPKRTREET